MRETLRELLYAIPGFKTLAEKRIPASLIAGEPRNDGAGEPRNDGAGEGTSAEEGTSASLGPGPVAKGTSSARPPLPERGEDSMGIG